MKKRLISLILAFCLLAGVMPAALAASAGAEQAAVNLYELGLFKGTGTNPDGSPSFSSNRAPTRHEAVTMLVRLLGREEEALAGKWEIPFTDVVDWAKPYVGYAYANGLTSGTSATTFSGNKTVTASQYLTFVLRSLGYESGTDFKWDAAWELSDRLGITSGEYGPQTAFLRADAALISSAALGARLKSGDSTLVRSLAESGAVEAKTAAALGYDVYGLTESVHFLYDIRTFTLYAFMNYTGYDDNNNRPIRDTRAALRADLAAMDIQISVPNYYKIRGAREFDYAAALTAMGEAPDFRYLSTSEVHPSLGDLPAKLSEFYVAADIPALYEKYRPDHEALLARYRQALPDLVKMVSYFDEQDRAEAEFGLEVVLLDAWNRGSGLGKIETLFGYGVIRTGPADGVNTLNLLHEYAHGFVNRALDANKSRMSALSGYFRRDCDAIRQGYDTWNKIVYESFVRAVSTYFDSTLTASERSRIIQRDVELGFVMTEYVYRRIPEFAEFEGSFTAFIELLLTEYPSTNS